MVPCDDELFDLIFKKLNLLSLMFCEGKVLRGFKFYIYKVLCIKVRFKSDSFRGNYFLKHFHKQVFRQTRQLAS